MQIIVVSGLSGSGKTTALHVLEDLGYYCVDNLPVGLLPAFAHEMEADVRSPEVGAAVGIDARNPADELERLPDTIARLGTSGVSCQILFLDADDATLLKRFSETRRKHPLSGPDTPLADAIRRERGLLEPLSASADLRFDTTHTTLHQLRDLVLERVRGQRSGGLSVLFQSFGYKHGIPTDADFVFDLRCLPNPHWEPHLRPYSGKDAPVARFLEKEPLVEAMFDHISGFLEAWIPRFEADNRSYLTVALGCTGGQHRSVYLAERLARHFQQRRPNVLTRHRELT
jgi:UPF0042 nucleotide-binding protein